MFVTKYHPGSQSVFQWVLKVFPFWTGVKNFKLKSYFYVQIWASTLDLPDNLSIIHVRKSQKVVSVHLDEAFSMGRKRHAQMNRIHFFG